MQDEKRCDFMQAGKNHIKTQPTFFPKTPLFFIPIIHCYTPKQRKIRQENPRLLRSENSVIHSLAESKNDFLPAKRKTKNNKAFQNKKQFQ